MARIEPLDPDKADAKTRALLDELGLRWGETWNISRGLAHNPAVLEAFMALNAALDRSGLSPTDREVICMEMARANGCHYCVPAHRSASRQAGVDAAMIERIAQGEALDGDGREAVIQRLVRRLVATKGKLADEDYAAFLDDGVAPPEMIAVVAEIAHCTLTNFFNRLARTELDPFLEDYRD
ncbi:MAG: carboxymuconolactone decarboxylase family protein [Rhodospirillales bacterium]|nr:carboxymuconolactone decarboxylase family protein [Rhodospirillales bacterium]